jgi:hypothetical protein
MIDAVRKDYVFRGILLIQIMLLVDLIVKYFMLENKPLSLVRYGVYFVSTIYLIRGVMQSHRTPNILELVFFGWAIYLIIDGFMVSSATGYDNPHFKLFLSGGYTLNILPLLMIYAPTESFFRKYFRLAYLYAFFSVFALLAIFVDIFILRWAPLAEAYTFLASGLALILMTYSYWSRTKRTNAFAIMIFVILIMMLLGRRNKVVYFGSIMFFAVLLNTFAKSYFSNANKKINTIFIIAIAGLLLASIFSTELDSFMMKMDTGMHSREGVIDLFFEDFNNHPSDWVFGRGMFGEYLGGVLSTNELDGTRNGIENGYLQLILNGGWIWLGAMILCSLKAIYLGLFKSRNIFCKGMALVILVYYIDMIGFGIPNLWFAYFNVFLSIAGCHSKWLRSQTDLDLQPKLKFYR